MKNHFSSHPGTLLAFLITTVPLALTAQSGDYTVRIKQPVTDTIKSCPGKSLVFMAEGQNADFSSFDPTQVIFTWDFGFNGQTRTGPNVTFTYPEGGHYLVRLYVTGRSGRPSAKNVPEKHIYVGMRPSFTGTRSDLTSICSGQEISLTGFITVNPWTKDNYPFENFFSSQDFEWDGSGIQSDRNGIARIEPPLNKGHMNYSFRVKDNFGCFHDTTLTLYGVYASYSSNPKTGEAPLQVNMAIDSMANGGSENSISFSWDFYEITDSTKIMKTSEPTFILPVPGVYKSRLISKYLQCSYVFNSKDIIHVDPAIGQDIRVTFSGTSGATTIDSVMATNLATNKSVTLPGDETLVLTTNSGVAFVPILTDRSSVFPNPFSGSATLSVFVTLPQAVDLKVQNLFGQLIAQSRAFLQPGEHQFAITLSTVGIHVVTITTDNGTSSLKVICTDAGKSGNDLKIMGSGQNRTANPGQSEFKTSQTNYILGYTAGDVILYRCMSGLNSTILTDSPTESKNYVVQFLPCLDPDGKNYAVVKIGAQWWMAENLAFLPAVGPSSYNSYDVPSHYVYGYEGTSVIAAKATYSYVTYGVLYNWEAAKIACPPGWYLPTDEQWLALSDYLGSSPGAKMKETGISHWGSPNLSATNVSGFSALPGGERTSTGGFVSLGYFSYFWSATANGSAYAWDRNLLYDGEGVYRYFHYRSEGFSVRCLRY